jgi:hypothetical protein
VPTNSKDFSPKMDDKSKVFILKDVIRGSMPLVNMVEECLKQFQKLYGNMNKMHIMKCRFSILIVYSKILVIFQD